MRCRSAAVVNSHRALAAYSNYLETTTARYIVWSAASHNPCARSSLSACRVCAQELTTFCTWSATDRRLMDTVTLSIFNEHTRTMSGNGGGGAQLRVLLLVNSNSMHFLGWNEDCCEGYTPRSTLSISATLLWTFTAGIMIYVSSAYLPRLFPGVTERRSAAVTT